MKKIIKSIALALSFALAGVVAHAQTGLNGIVVEKYYISNAADATYSADALPAGSVTYRVYVDMKPNWKFQAAYGNSAHTLKMSTTTTFFNSSNGAATPDNITKVSDATNTTMLDSWVSVGAACKLNAGVLKTDDGAGGGATNVNNTPAAPGGKILQGTSLIAGIPIKTQDGLWAGSPSGTTFTPTFDQTAIDGSNPTPNLLQTSTDAWSSLAGATSPLNPTSNRVLIAQMTTNGVFHIELNVQIGDPTGSFTEKYVVSSPNASNGEFAGAALGTVQTFTPDVPPVCTITSPPNHSVYIAGASVAITANANDNGDGGTIDSVSFFVDGIRVGAVNGPGPVFNLTPGWNSTGATYGSHFLTAVATSHDLGQTTSAVDTIVVQPAHQPYGIISSTNNCEPGTFCLPIASQDPVANVIGYDMVLHYDATKVAPTGTITVSNAMITPSYVDAVYSNGVAGVMNISLYFNASAPANAKFTGIGNLICVEFAKTGNFATVDTANFSVTNFQESYVTGVSPTLVDAGQYISHRDSSFTGSLKFWADNSAIKYDAAHPSTYLITNVYGNNNTCTSQSATAVQPDFLGNFTYNIGNGQDLNIKRDILGTTDVQPVINGFDAFLTRRVLINDAGFTPSVFQAIAMDVNQDGVISAGDLSQINQRAVLLIPEFKQAWNYDVAGNRLQPLNAAFNSKDWTFVDLTRLSINAAFNRSTTYPGDDGVGFSKARVPAVPSCLPVPNATVVACQLANSETYDGILLGDINGNFATVGSNGNFRQTESDKVVFDLTKAVIKDGYADVPVVVMSSNAVNALDFSMQLSSGLSFNSIVDHTNYLETLSNVNADDNTLRVTSSSLQNYDLGKSLVSVRFATAASKLTANDLNSVTAYLNGERVGAQIKSAAADAVADISVYPNPAQGLINVVSPENATIQMLDMDGRQVALLTNVNANEKQVINIQNLANGIYTLKVYNDNFVSMQRVIVQK